MAINRVPYPANLTDQGDFSEHGELIETRFMDQSAVPLRVIGGNIPQGSVFQIGGVVYRADTDTAISGTASDYVRIVPAGATAAAEYVANLTGVTWTPQYSGYYDASGNLYIFDEGKALAAGEITAVFGRYLMQQANGDVAVGRNLDVNGSLAISGPLSGVTTIAASGNIDGAAVNTGQGDTEVHPMNQAVRTTDSVTFVSLYLNGSFMPETTPSSGLEDVSSTLGAEWVPPRGIYQMVNTQGVAYIYYYSNGDWRGSGVEWTQGTIVTDGASVKFIAGGTTNLRIYWVKF